MINIKLKYSLQVQVQFMENQIKKNKFKENDIISFKKVNKFIGYKKLCYFKNNY